MKIKTEHDVVIASENYLGWTAPRGVDLWRARMNETARLKKAMTKAGVTLEDVALALELSRRSHNYVKSPSALVWRVEMARERAVEPVVRTEIAQQIQDAIDFEMDQQGNNWERWVSRLTRCVGEARVEVFEEWSTSRLAEAA